MEEKSSANNIFMSITTESKPLIGLSNLETPSDYHAVKSSVLPTEGTTNTPRDEIKISSSPKNIFQSKFSKILRPKFLRFETTPQFDSINFTESKSVSNNTAAFLTPKEQTITPKTNPNQFLFPKPSPSIDSLNPNTEKGRPDSPKRKAARNGWKSLLNLGESEVTVSKSANVSGSSTPKASTVTKMRRKSTQDRRTLEMQKDDESGKSVGKKPGVDFTLGHFKLLRKQIKNEKIRLEKDIQEAVEEKEKKESVLSLSVSSSKKWEKAKTNVLALARLKRLKDDLRLWGSNMHMSGPSGQLTNLKMLMPENQVDVGAPEKKKKILIIYPENKFGDFWPAIYLLAMLYTAFVTPYRIAFLDDLPTWWIVFEQVIDGIFMCDIIINLNTAIVLESGQVIDSRKEIFKNYLKGWLIIDLFALFPFTLIFDSYGGGRGNDFNDLLKFVRLPRLYKLVRVARVFKVMKGIKRNKYFRNIQESLRINISSLRMINFLSVLLLSVHVFACLWYFSANFYNFAPGTWVYELGLTQESNLTLYITSVYWVVSTLTTVGFGDVHAYNDFERVLSIFWIVIGVGFYSLNIGAMTSLLANKDSREGNLSLKLALMDEFAKETGLPKDLRLKIKRTLEYNSLRNVFNQYERNEFFDEIPIDVKSEMAEVMHRGVITKLKFFKNKDRVFIATMVPLLHPLKISKGEVIYRTGEYPTNIYFIISGRVNIVVGAHMLNLKTYVQGSYFGEIEMMNNTIRQSTLRAEMDCELLTLSRKAFLRLMEDFPNYHEELKMIAEERQLRIAEALRKIKRLLPISSNSKFWEKKRQYSLYDLDDVQKNKDSASSGDQNDKDKGSSSKQSRFQSQLSHKNMPDPSSLGNKIEEEENEDDEEEGKVDIPRRILEDKEASGKIANLINVQELKEEQNKIAKWISQMQYSKALPGESKQPSDPNPQLTETQLQTKLMQAEGDSKKKKPVLVVKGANKLQKTTIADKLRDASKGKNRSDSVSPKRSPITELNEAAGSRDKQTNRRSYFFKASKIAEETTPMRRSQTFKPPKKGLGGLFGGLFSQKPVEEDKKKSSDVKVLKNEFGEKIDILKIPTKVIQNFSQKVRSTSKEKAINVNKNALEAPNMNQSQIMSKDDDDGTIMARDDNYLSAKQGPAKKTFSDYFLSVDIGNRRKSFKEDELLGSETHKKVLVVNGVNFETKNKNITTIGSLTSNEEDEIPDIALGLVSSDDLNKDFHLNIYHPPSTDYEAEKFFSSFWGGSNNGAVQEKGDSNKTVETPVGNAWDKFYLKRKEDQGEYKIKVIAPEQEIQENEKSAVEPRQDLDIEEKGLVISDLQQEEATKTENINADTCLKIAGETPSGKTTQTVEPSEIKNNKNNLGSELKNCQDPNENLETDNYFLSIQIPQKIERNLTRLGTLPLEIPQQDLTQTEKPKTSEVVIPINEKQVQIFPKNINNNNKEDRLGKLLSSIMEQSDTVNEEEGNLSKTLENRQNDFNASINLSEQLNHLETDQSPKQKESFIKDLKIGGIQDTKRKGLPTPPIETDAPWKKSKTVPVPDRFEITDETEEIRTKKTDNQKSSNREGLRKEKPKRKSKVSNNKYKEKYKNQCRYIKELLSSFKGFKKEFGDIQKEVGSIENRLDNFEKLIENLQGLMTRFAEKLKEQKKDQRLTPKVPSIENALPQDHDLDTNTAQTLSADKSHNFTSTVYMPQKKTIVFAFQKPEVRIKKKIEKDLISTERHPEAKNDQSVFKDSDLLTQDKLENEIGLDTAEDQTKRSKLETSFIDSTARIVGKNKGLELKSGFKLIKREDPYGTDGENDSFMNKTIEKLDT